MRHNDVSLVDVASQRIGRAGTGRHCSAHEGCSENGLELGQHRALRSLPPAWREEVLRNDVTSLMPDASVCHEKPPLSPCRATCANTSPPDAAREDCHQVHEGVHLLARRHRCIDPSWMKARHCRSVRRNPDRGQNLDENSIAPDFTVERASTRSEALASGRIHRQSWSALAVAVACAPLRDRLIAVMCLDRRFDLRLDVSQAEGRGRLIPASSRP